MSCCTEQPQPVGGSVRLQPACQARRELDAGDAGETFKQKTKVNKAIKSSVPESKTQNCPQQSFVHPKCVFECVTQFSGDYSTLQSNSPSAPQSQGPPGHPWAPLAPDKKEGKAQTTDNINIKDRRSSIFMIVSFTI